MAMTSSSTGRPHHYCLVVFPDVDVGSSPQRLRWCRRRPLLVFIPAITALEVAFFIYQVMTVDDAMLARSDQRVQRPRVASSQSIARLLVYRPDKQRQLWRFFLYMFVHAGWRHLLFNAVAQLVVGVPLELMHGALRTAVIYMAGVLAGSLATSVFDSDAGLVGASGGVYALIAAHLPSIFLNYREVELGILKLIAVCVVACVDVGLTVSESYSVDVRQHHLRLSSSSRTTSVGYVAHLMGAAAGVLTGFVVLRRSSRAPTSDYNRRWCWRQ